MSQLDDVLQEFRQELGAEFVSSFVVGLDGMPIGGGSMSPEFDADAASARFAMVMKLASKIGGKFEFGAVDDNLITTDEAFILNRFLGDGSYYWGVAVTREATLGYIRLLMKEYANQLWEVIPRS